MKQCGDCGESKPLDAFNRRRADSEARKSICRDCQRSYRQRHYLENREQENAQWREKRAQNLDAEKDRWADYYARNRERLAARRRESYAADPDRGRQAVADWRRRNPGSHARWRAANPERWKALNRANQARRRAGKQPVDLAAILERDGWFCHICSFVIVDWDDLHFDHVIPLARQGTNDPENIRPAHALCNLRKGDKLIEEMAS